MAYYDALVLAWKDLTGTPQDKLNSLNTSTVAGPNRPVPIAEVMTYLRSNGLWLPIKARAGTNPAAAAAVDIAEDLRASTIDFDLPIVQQLLSALVATSLLSQANADALVAMKVTSVPWRQSVGYESELCPGDLVASGLVNRGDV